MNQIEFEESKAKMLSYGTITFLLFYYLNLNYIFTQRWIRTNKSQLTYISKHFNYRIFGKQGRIWLWWFLQIETVKG